MKLIPIFLRQDWENILYNISFWGRPIHDIRKKEHANKLFIYYNLITPFAYIIVEISSSRTTPL